MLVLHLGIGRSWNHIPSKSAIYVQTFEFKALMIILRSVGPVISTLRSANPGAGIAALHVTSSLMCLVSGRKSGRAPLSSSACLITRRWRSSFLLGLKDLWRRARKAMASFVRIFLLDSLMVPEMLTPWMIESMLAIFAKICKDFAVMKFLVYLGLGGEGNIYEGKLNAYMGGVTWGTGEEVRERSGTKVVTILI